ncbi:MAG: hypothetical protein IPM55_15670 [Acidobacteria bacterium]|nr:hypothetical protein [Acidobacteriota bacterium]
MPGIIARFEFHQAAGDGTTRLKSVLHAILHYIGIKGTVLALSSEEQLRKQRAATTTATTS